MNTWEFDLVCLENAIYVCILHQGRRIYWEIVSRMVFGDVKHSGIIVGFLRLGPQALD
jgi:hypothetical protein